MGFTIAKQVDLDCIKQQAENAGKIKPASSIIFIIYLL